jgi:hypothetical protein
VPGRKRGVVRETASGMRLEQFLCACRNCHDSFPLSFSLVATQTRRGEGFGGKVMGVATRPSMRAGPPRCFRSEGLGGVRIGVAMHRRTSFEVSPPVA